MMKKTLLIFPLFIALAFSNIAHAASTDDGNLKLDPNVITNSEVGSKTVGNIANTGQLFSLDLDKKSDSISDSLQKDVNVKSSLDFSQEKKNSLIAADNEGTVAKLFNNYAPQNIATTDASGVASNESQWLILIASVGGILVIVASFMGRRYSRQKNKKQDRITEL